MLNTALRAALTWLTLTGAAAAQQDVARVDLLPGWRDDGRHVAGLRIALAPGWKTYWRSPGDAGLPPQFNWSGSRNLASVRILWPVPHVFVAGGLTSVGYKDALLLPVEFVPVDPRAPIDIALDLDMGVCEDICVPVNARVTGTLPPGEVRPDARIRAAIADRPLTAAEAGVGRVTCDFAPTERGVRLTATISMPPSGNGEFAMIEMSDPGLYVSQAGTSRQGDTLTASAAITPPRGKTLALDRQGVRFTILSDRGAVDIQGCG